MVFKLDEFYTEPGYFFDVSYKVYLFISNLIDLSKIELERTDYKFLILTINSGIDIKKIEIKGPEYDKRNKVINFSMLIPFIKIKNEDQFLEYFMKNMFEGFDIFLKSQTFIRFDIDAIKPIIYKEIIGNSSYYYEDDL